MTEKEKQLFAQVETLFMDEQDVLTKLRNKRLSLGEDASLESVLQYNVEYLYEASSSSYFHVDKVALEVLIKYFKEYPENVFPFNFCLFDSVDAASQKEITFQRSLMKLLSSFIQKYPSFSKIELCDILLHYVGKQYGKNITPHFAETENLSMAFYPVILERAMELSEKQVSSNPATSRDFAKSFSEEIQDYIKIISSHNQMFSQTLDQTRDIQNLYDKAIEDGYEIATKLNKQNLKQLQETIGEFVTVKTRTERRSSSYPKPSQSKLLVSEEIEQNLYGDPKRYLITREYNIPVENTEELHNYRRAFYQAKKMRFTSITNKTIFEKDLCPPHINYRTLQHHIRRSQLEQKILTDYNTSKDDKYIIMLFFRKYYPFLKEDMIPFLKNILDQKSPNTTIHDALFCYIDLDYHAKFLTPAAMKYVLSLPKEELKPFSSYLTPFSKDKAYISTIRKAFSYGVHKKLTQKEMLQLLEEKYEKFSVLQYNLSHEQLELITKNYLPILQKYASITMREFLHIFGKDGVNTILKKEKKSIFKPKEYRLPSLEKIILASIVNEKLGTRNDEDNLKTRQKLYHKLSLIMPVDDILQGQIPEEIIPLIKKTIGLSPNKDLDSAKKYVAKIEERCSPESLIAGDASVCCMDIRSEKAKTYALNPGFAIFNVYFNGRIIANSVLWVNNKDTLVVDNIEVHPNYEHHDTYIKEMYFQMINDMSKKYKNIVQGSSYNDLSLFDEKAQAGVLSNWNPIAAPTSFYSDARYGCYLIRGDKNILNSPYHQMKEIFDEEDLFEDQPPDIAFF